MSCSATVAFLDRAALQALNATISPEIKTVRNVSPLVLKTQGLWEVRGNGAGNVSGNCETEHVLDLHCLSRQISLFF